MKTTDEYPPIYPFFHLSILQESFHPSTSSMEINSCPSSTEARYAEQEGKQSDVMRILESDSTRTNTPDTTAALQKPVGEINASILVKVNDKLGEPHEDTAQIALANLGEEVNKSSRPVFNTTVRINAQRT